MDKIDELQRKPRRTRGTPSYHYRNRFAAAGILAGSAIFTIWYFTPIFRIASEKIRKSLVETEEEKDRKFTFSKLGAAPRSSKAIQETLDDKNKLLSER